MYTLQNNTWQNEWEISNTKLNKTRNYILLWPNNSFTGKEEITTNRPRIGQTKFTRAFLMKRKVPSICPIYNNCPLTDTF